MKAIIIFKKQKNADLTMFFACTTPYFLLELIVKEQTFALLTD